MTKTVAFMGTEGGVSFSGMGFEAAFNHIGLNTGNALFQYALWRLIRDPKLVVAPGSNVELLRETADILVIPAANQVNPAWDLAGWADFVEAVDLPIVCIGLGAQSKIDSSPKLDLKPGTVRYLEAVAERAQQIGVRGQFTQEVLAHIGITNTVITGCPSQTINKRVKGADIQKSIDDFGTADDPSIGYVLGTLEPGAREVDQLLAAQVKATKHDIILQTDPRLLSLIHSRDVEAADRSYIDWIASILRPDLDVDGFMNYLLNDGRFYSDARTWIDAMRRHDLVLGMRIHGAVAAIQAERLGICVAFDSRTLELANTMGYPYIRSSDIRADMSLQDIVAKTVFDAPRFDHLRQKKTELVLKLLHDADLTAYQ